MVDVGSKEGAARHAELKTICNRRPAVPSIVINERIALQRRGLGRNQSGFKTRRAFDGGQSDRRRQPPKRYQGSACELVLFTYRGERIDATEVFKRLGETAIKARVGYREDKPGWGRVVSLDLESDGSSPKEAHVAMSLLLIFGCTGGMAIIAKTG